MSFSRSILVASVSLLATTLAAQSDGLYGGRGSLKDDIPVAAPIGCPTHYVRLDGGFTNYDRPSATQAGIDDLYGTRIEGTGSIGGGFGRYFSCNLRGDITFDHRFESDFKGSNGNPVAPNFGSMKWGYSSTSILANIYYDFNPGSRITPYIGFGLGTVNNRFARGTGVVGAGVGGAGNAVSVGGSDDWHVAAAAMTGFVLNLSDRLKLDTGYRFMYLGATKTGQTRDTVFGGVGGPVHVDNLHAHEFRIGLRYDIR